MRALTIYSSTGVKQTAGASLAAGTYYGELPPGDFERARLGTFLFRWDNTHASAITFEVTNDPAISVWAAASAGWAASPAPAPSDLSTLTVPGGSASTGVRHAIDVGFGRIRFKAVVGTAGVLEPFGNTKDG